MKVVWPLQEALEHRTEAALNLNQRVWHERYKSLVGMLVVKGQLRNLGKYGALYLVALLRGSLFNHTKNGL
jgi:hypothetical protein